MARKRVAILISGRGSNMTALIEAAAAPDYPAEIVLVVANRPDAGGLVSAQAAGIATAVVAHASYGADREGFERALLGTIAPHRIDIICLAGFMRLLSPLFIGHFEGHILNIHPALLPAFRGLHTHERALESGVKIHGATVHVVIPELDSGPIIAQGAVPVQEDDTVSTLASRVLTVEHRLYPRALKLMAEGRIRIENGRCRIDVEEPALGTLHAP